MCASYQARFNLTQLVRLFEQGQAPLSFDGGRPNIEPIDEVRPDIERALVQLGSRKATERWLEKLRRNAYVKHF